MAERVGLTRCIPAPRPSGALRASRSAVLPICRTAFKSLTLSKNNGAPKGPVVLGGEGGIRTHEGQLTLAGFQDQCIQPLCHLSQGLYYTGCSTAHSARRPPGIQQRYADYC